MANRIEYKYIPQPRQELLHSCPARQILYGGAAGGGKSRAARAEAFEFAVNIPGLQVYLFRRNFKQLYKNHIIPMSTEINKRIAHFRGQELIFHNETDETGPSIIHFCHCNNLLDYLDYQGTEMHVLIVDEASLFFPIQLIELRARVRLGSFAAHIPEAYASFLPRAVFTSNPGGPSHTFLKQTFIDAAPPMSVFKDKLMEGLGVTPWSTCYIPARMSDNQYLDEGYAAVFQGMNPGRAAALRDGDWDAVEGAALFSLSRMRHAVKPFIPPIHWTRFQSLDWGTAKPFSVGWYAVASEDTIVKKNEHLFSEENPTGTLFIPAGSVIRYREWYGCAEKQPDVGIYLDSTEVARTILQKEREREMHEGDRAPDYRVCDNAIFASIDGPSIADRMREATQGTIVFRYVKKDRMNQYEEVLARLAGNPFIMHNGKTEKHPALFISTGCINAWRTLPSLMVDPEKPDEGPDGGEDHVYDEMKYALASYPYVTTKRDRDDDIATLRSKATDPYRVR
jgi:hypothetical protein